MSGERRSSQPKYVGLMLGQPLRRWPNIKTTLDDMKPTSWEDFLNKRLGICVAFCKVSRTQKNKAWKNVLLPANLS